MHHPFPFLRLALAACLGLGLASAARAEKDPRRIVCAQACTLELKAANGLIEVKVPTASAVLKTLYRSGDRFDLEGGQDYVLMLNESMDGFFTFDLQFSPKDGGPAWSCRVRTIADPPFISVDHAAWSGRAGKVVVNTADRTKPLIALDTHP
jgi:hypothetical protein